MDTSTTPMTVHSDDKNSATSLRSQLSAWVVIISLWGFWTVVIVFGVFHTSWSLYDYGNYYHAAQRFSLGLDINLSVEASVTYLYPPLLAQILSPFVVSLPFMGTAIIWTVTNILCLILSTALLASQVESRWKRYVVWVLPVLFAPTFETYFLGQVVPLLYLMFVGVLVGYRYKQYVLVGALLALAAWLKVYPIFFIFYFMLRREWKVVISAFVVGMTLLFFQISLSGIDVLVNYFTITLVELASKGQDFNLTHNHSLLGLLRKVMEDNPSLILVTRLIITSVMMFIMFKVSNLKGYKKLSELPFEEFEIEYGMVIVFTMLIGSTLYGSGMLPILIPMVAILKYSQSARFYGILLLLYLSVGLTFFIFYNDVFSELHPLIQGFGFYVLFAFWGLVVYFRWKAQN